ncbi:MAG: hypothetical protein ABSA59_24630 [Terriglobia bacterium]|jgi:hypothetical protein
MRKRITIVASLLIVLAAGLAYGQSSPFVVKVNVPFNFMAGEKEMPAGEYNIRKDNPGVLTVYDSGSEHTINVIIIAHLAPSASKHFAGVRLVFGTVGGQKFLSEVWPSDTEYGYLVHAQNGQ